MKVIVLLADKGTNNLQQGTLNLLNVGWGVTQLLPMGITPPHAVAIFFEAELADCNRQFMVTVELITEDGQGVVVPSPAGPQPLRMTQQTMVPSPPGVPTGTVGRANFMLELASGLPVGPGTYTWRVSIDGHEDWTAATSFYVAPPPQMPQFGYAGGPVSPPAPEG